VKILVVVAYIQVRTLKAEVGKGFARTAFDRESVDPEAQINLENQAIGFCRVVKLCQRWNYFVYMCRKGIRINIPELIVRYLSAVTQMKLETAAAIPGRVLFSV
jgi:hypothetical protein